MVLEQADGLRSRVEFLVVPGIQETMMGAVAFGRLLNDLKIDCSRSSFRSWCSDEGIDRELSTGSWRNRPWPMLWGVKSSSAMPAATCWSADER